MLFLLLYGLLNLLPCLLAAAAEGAVCVSARRRNWRRWVPWLLPCILAALGLGAACVLLLRDTAWTQGNTAGQNAVTVAARLFICLLPCLAALIALGAARLRPAWGKVLLVALLIGILPVGARANDGGSVKYAALLYSITFYHQIDDTLPGGFRTDTEVQVAPFHFMQENN